MYRYNVDNTVTYTPDDIVLFRESPFAIWMERLTLENPDHGILPDVHSTQPHDTQESRDYIVATLRAEGRNVVLIDGDMDEPERRTATLAAMRGGADFIVNGQLAVGTLSGGVNLLMRTSGYSQLGDFLYIPCETKASTSLHAAFRLSFFADLLHHLQGQLPPQMLIISDGADVVPLQTEDYIYYYRAVQQRFEHTMNNFRKHRMPDPAESSHFGRWADCASEVLKQRAEREQQAAEQQAQEQRVETAYVEELEIPQLRVASGAVTTASLSDRDVAPQQGLVQENTIRSTLLEARSLHSGEPGQTLAEQARLLAPDSYRNVAAPGHTPNLARIGPLRPDAVVPEERETEHNRRSSDAALQNLEFIGSSATEHVIGTAPLSLSEEATSLAPAPNLREAPKQDARSPDPMVKSTPARLPDLEPRAPLFLPPDNKPSVKAPPQRLEIDPLDSELFKFSAHSVIDMDSAPAPSLAPALKRAAVATGDRPGLLEAGLTPAADPARMKASPDEKNPGATTFSSSLITSEVFDD
jgi:hypothetical protein